MTVTIETATLVGLLKVIKFSIEARSTVPQLAHITFRADAGAVTMTATDLDMELTLELPGAVMDCAPFTLPWSDLSKFAASADKGALLRIEPGAEDPDADFVLHNAELDGLSARMDGYKMADMPEAMSTEFLPTAIVMPESELHLALATAQHAISTDQTRYYLNGIYMHANDQTRDALAFVATDGQRLAYIKTRHETAIAEGLDHWQMQCIVPTKAVSALLAALDGKSQSPVVIQWCESKFSMAGASFKFISKAVDGTFPDYTRGMPRDNECRLSLDHATINKQLPRMRKLGVEGIALHPDCGKIDGAHKDKPQSVISFAHDFSPSDIVPEPFRLNAAYFAETLASAVNLGGCASIEKSASAGDPLTVLPDDCGPFEECRFVLMPLRKGY